MVYLQYDEAPLAYYAFKKTGAKSIADLAGKTIVGAPFEVTREMFPPRDVPGVRPRGQDRPGFGG